jgi:3',5'-cyclic AMP phosphodiesterase CpdA
MRLLLLGDLHFARSWLMPHEWFCKRLLGQINYLLHRRHKFDHGLLPGLLKRALAEKPEWALLTGDFTTTALRREFADARTVLEGLREQVPILSIPGNHDRYTFASARHKRMEHELGWAFGLPEQFPKMTRLGGRWHVLQLDSACPRVLSSRGRLDQAQLLAAEMMLDRLGPDDGVVVMCHYPLYTPQGVKLSFNRDMEGRRHLTKLLRQAAPRIVFVHGHIHQPWHLTREKDDVPFDCINTGAPCQKSGDFPTGQGFWIVDLPVHPRGGLVAAHHVG